jgi:phosphoribosylaminoimidazole-succinocarboxamide synthase
VLVESFLRSGKVRDLHMLADQRLLLVASDRISAFDVILPTEIPDKGRVLTGLSRFWFAETASIVPNHLLDTDVSALRASDQARLEAAGEPAGDPGTLDDLRGRIMICRPASVVPVEAVVRGYLAGSGWKEYQERGTVCGVRLPSGLRESDRLPEPIFTPATKAELGEHDQNVTFDEMVDHLAMTWMPSGDAASAGAVGETIRELALRLYGYAAAISERAGIILADTKFEFGRPLDVDATGELMLIDEALTPDSSRFWDAAFYAPGRPQASFDKQFVRDWLETQPWDKTAPGPALPDDVIEGTRTRYIEAYERITGASFERYLEEDVIAS